MSQLQKRGLLLLYTWTIIPTQKFNDEYYNLVHVYVIDNPIESLSNF